MQTPLTQAKIAYLGNTGSYSHQAATIFAYNMQSELNDEPCGTFGEIFEKVSGSKEIFGAIPLENSSMGTIVANYDLFWTAEAKLIRELYLSIHHNLIALPEAKIDSIVQVYSHPAALEQCRKLFKIHPHMKPMTHWDTSAAVMLVREKNDPTIAAIGSSEAAKEHGLVVLRPHVEDFEHNTTRFGLIANKHFPLQLLPPYKMSFAVELPHMPGALGKLLAQINELKINLTKCESRPIPENAWQYRFFLDLEIAMPEQNQQVCELIGSATKQHKMLGIYSAANDN